MFDGRYVVALGQTGRSYDVSLDGQRFSMVKDAAAGDQNATSASIVIVEHWFEELKRLVPGGR